MKQHISIEQLNELSEKGKERLSGWWYRYLSKHHKIQTYRDLTSPLLSLGEMIEFLVDNQSIQGMRGDEYGYLVMPVQTDEVEKLCDVLWKEVKEILEK